MYKLLEKMLYVRCNQLCSYVLVYSCHQIPSGSLRVTYYSPLEVDDIQTYPWGRVIQGFSSSKQVDTIKKMMLENDEKTLLAGMFCM